MKYCLNCGRGLFEKDHFCDKCNSKKFITETEVNKIIYEIKNANPYKKNKLLKNDLYKQVNDKILNAKVDSFKLDFAPSQEYDRKYWNRIQEHTISSIQSLNKPKCPTCGSLNVEKISTGKKVFGGAMFGLFSSDVRNTMHCKNCGYKW